MIGQFQEVCPDAKMANATSMRDSDKLWNLVVADQSKEIASNLPGTEKKSNSRHANNLLHV